MSAGWGREISVRLLSPQELEESTIYVVLGPKEKEIEARAFSGEDFKYRGEVIPGSSRNILRQGWEPRVATNLGTGTFDGSVVLDYELFIDELAKENGARVNYEVLWDGIEMKRAFGIIERF